MNNTTGLLVNLFYLHRKYKFQNYHPVPMGCLSLLSALKRSSYQARFFDYQFIEKDKAFRADVITSKCKAGDSWIGISCMSDMLPYALEVLKNVKETYPNILTILGGPGATPVAESVVKTFEEVDIVVRGEGELTILKIMEHLEGKQALKNILGITFRSDNGRVVTCEDQDRIVDLDELGLPLFELLDMKNYNSVSLMTSRGCFHNCAFCELGCIWGSRITKHSVEYVIDAISHLHYMYNIKKLSIDDDNMLYDYNRVMKLCGALKKNELDIKWDCLGRVDCVDTKLLRTMNDSGCDGIFYGIESGDEDVLKRIKPRISTGMAVEAVHRTLEASIIPTTSFIWGFPFEDTNQFFNTLKMVTYFRIVGAEERISNLSACNGSPLYQEYGDNLCTRADITQLNPNISVTHISRFNHEVVHNINEYPQIFSSFFTYDHQSLTAKSEAMKRFLRMWPF